MNKWLCAMLCILFCSCSDRTINATAHSSTASKDISLYNDGPAKSLLLMHVGPERKTISPVIFFSSEEGCLDAISDVPEYLREIVKKEPLRAEIISDLYKFIADKPPSRSALFGTTLIAFYRSKSRAQYTLDHCCPKQLRMAISEHTKPNIINDV